MTEKAASSHIDARQCDHETLPSQGNVTVGPPSSSSTIACSLDTLELQRGACPSSDVKVDKSGLPWGTGAILILGLRPIIMVGEDSWFE